MGGNDVLFAYPIKVINLNVKL